ncbi:unnamed protein product [Phytophthora lilii]|uniref:Unnamed protein product n=1 Tax=Phytophthora lilii TaxID=2077276 RepID=A0A9W6X4K2_9STRA|nr:unnamed protein product [Phytophthora lilii]
MQKDRPKQYKIQLKRIWFSTTTATNCDASRPQGPTPGPNVPNSPPPKDAADPEAPFSEAGRSDCNGYARFTVPFTTRSPPTSSISGVLKMPPKEPEKTGIYSVPQKSSEVDAFAEWTMTDLLFDRRSGRGSLLHGAFAKKSVAKPFGDDDRYFAITRNPPHVLMLLVHIRDRECSNPQVISERDWSLVMRDESNTEGRTFAAGDDHLWTAIEKSDGVNAALEFYAIKMTSTECDDADNCYLYIESDIDEKNITVRNDYISPPGYENVSFYY